MQSEYPSASEAETGNARTATGGSAESELQDNEQSCVQVDTGLDHSMEDQEEAEAIEAFFEKEKCCSLGPKKSACWKQFQRKFLIDARRDSVQLQRQSSSPRSNINYCLAGKCICKSTFLFMYAIQHTRLENLIKHYSTEGLQGRIHKNSKKQPHNRTSAGTISHVKGFIEKLPIITLSLFLVACLLTRITKSCCYPLT